jgi:serine/threonine-protein kinase
MSSTGSPGNSPHGKLLGGRYRVGRELARGGMASVHVAVDERLGRQVAIKVLSGTYARKPAFVKRFLAEARTAAGFSHPNLAHVYDSGSDGDVHFIAMELLDEHRSLRELLRARGRLEPAEVIEIARAVLSGLGELHSAGLVHCDVKSANIMIGVGETKLIDFGIARPMRSGSQAATSLGSLHSMPPEQLRGDATLTPAADLFAMGVVMYEALTGRIPFPGGDAAAVAAAQRAGVPAPPSAVVDGIGERVDLVVLQALSLEPERRFASARAMEVALEAAAGEGPERSAAGDDTTVIVAAEHHPVRRAPVAASMSGAAAVPPRSARAGDRRAPSRGLGAIGWLGVVALPVIVALFLVLGQPNGSLGTAASPSPPPAETQAQATPTPAGSLVEVPNTIGMSEEEAQDAAQALGLNWRIEWRVDAGKTPGVYAQDPAPGTPVAPGSRFVMQAYRAD